MLKNNTVTKSEINTAQVALLAQNAWEKMEEKLGLDTETYTLEEKEILFNKFLEILLNEGYMEAGLTSEKSEIDPSNRGDNDGKIESI